MINNLKVFKQETCEGCLPVCLLSLTGIRSDKTSELNLIIEGFKRCRESYAFGIICEFAEKFNIKSTIFVDNKFFLKSLSKLPHDFKLELFHRKIDQKFLKNLELPYILYIDSNILGTYTHSPHFVIIEKRLADKFVLIDPWKGKRIKINKDKLLKGVDSLRSYLKFCPLAIKLD